ncbi:hypothetical protein SUGI_0889330 [Cryptomeria japonica]|nr:hypothetical protein SUGI_0889330 [Cryptomeria japonica]
MPRGREHGRFAPRQNCGFSPFLAAKKERFRRIVPLITLEYSDLRPVRIVPLITLEYSDWYWRAFLPAGASRDHSAANVMSSNSPDILAARLPASLVVIGGIDILRGRRLLYMEYL